MSKTRNSMVFIVTDQDRELMEAFRARRGLRSLAEALRTMIRESGADAEFTVPARYVAEVGSHTMHMGEPGTFGTPDTSGAKVTGPGRIKAPYGSRLKKQG